MMMSLAIVCLILFSILCIYDGVYIHLVREQLPSFPCSRHEHLIHTIRAFLLLPILALAFFSPLQASSYLAFTLFLVFLDFFFELYDLLVERNSRKPLGGMSWNEYASHIGLMGLRVAFLIFAIVGNIRGELLNAFETVVVSTVLLGSSVMAISYAVLVKKPELLNSWMNFRPIWTKPGRSKIQSY